MSPQNAVVIMEYVGKRTLLSLINDHPEALTEQFQAKSFRYNPVVKFSKVLGRHT